MKMEKRVTLFEILALIAFPVAIFTLLSNIEAFEWLHRFTRQHEDWDLDEKLMVVPAACIAILAFAIRRLINERLLLRKLAAAQADALRTAQLEAEKATLQRADAVKRDFLAVVSTELRTPLNAIIPMAELLRDSGLDAEQARCVDAIADQGEALRKMVESVLDFTEISAGALGRDDIPIDLGGLIADAATERRRQATAKGLSLTLKLAPGPRVLADPTLLWRLLDELVLNAVKFTQAGGVVVELALTEAGPGVASCSIQVIDTGPGIPPNERERVFQPFTQGDDGLTRRIGGLGIGLAKANALAAQLGGALTYADDPGGGARFTFAARFAVAEIDAQAMA